MYALWLVIQSLLGFKRNNLANGGLRTKSKALEPLNRIPETENFKKRSHILKSTTEYQTGPWAVCFVSQALRHVQLLEQSREADIIKHICFIARTSVTAFAE